MRYLSLAGSLFLCAHSFACGDDATDDTTTSDGTTGSTTDPSTSTTVTPTSTSASTTETTSTSTDTGTTTGTTGTTDTGTTAATETGSDSTGPSGNIPVGQTCEEDADCVSGICWDLSDYDPFCEGKVCSDTCRTDGDCIQLAMDAGANTPDLAECGDDNLCDFVGTGLGMFLCE